MIEGRITHGNAVASYRVAASQVFHTEFAAMLYAQRNCEIMCEEDQYHYWSIHELKNIPVGDCSGHLA